MSHSCAHQTPRSSYDDSRGCPTPASHVVYVDVLDEQGFLQPAEVEGAYTCLNHSGQAAVDALLAHSPACVHIVPVEPQADPS